MRDKLPPRQVYRYTTQLGSKVRLEFGVFSRRALGRGPSPQDFDQVGIAIYTDEDARKKGSMQRYETYWFNRGTALGEAFVRSINDKLASLAEQRLPADDASDEVFGIVDEFNN